MSHVQTDAYTESVRDTFFTHVENRNWDKAHNVLLELRGGYEFLEIAFVSMMEAEDLAEYTQYLKKTSCPHNYDESFY